MNYLNVVRKVVSSVPEQSADWLTAWRELADLTIGITKEDRRFGLVLDALTGCDDAFLRGDWAEFRRAATQLRAIIEGS